MELPQTATLGRPVKFKTADELLQAFKSYLAWSAANPLTVTDTKAQRIDGKRDGKSQYKQVVERPLTLAAFSLHAGIHRQWADFKKDYIKRSNAFCEVIFVIENTIRDQQVQNAMVGNYKENLVARLNGISDHVENNTNVAAVVTARKGMSVAEAKAMLAELDKEI